MVHLLLTSHRLQLLSRFLRRGHSRPECRQQLRVKVVELGVVKMDVGDGRGS